MSTVSENFVPSVHTFRLQGYGGEIVLGKVSNKSFEYFKNNGLDLIEYSSETKDRQKIPAEFRPFEPGNWFDCDEIAHEIGIEMDETCVIEVLNEYNSIVWAGNLDAATLEEAGCDVVVGEDIYASDQKPGSVLFYGQQFEKGIFFEGDLTLSSPFDVTKLKIITTEIEGWSICSSVEYDGVIIDNVYVETEEQNNHFAFIRVLDNGDTESYTDPDINDLCIYYEEDDEAA